MIYKFPTRRSSKPKFDPPQGNEKPPEEPMGLIQGQVPDSTQEWWVGKALNRLGVSYTYQYPVLGGRQRGGYLVDFVVDTVPLKTMFEIEGNHWHTGELGADDLKRKADIEDILQDVCRRPIVSLWVPDLIDEDAAFINVRRHLNGN